VGGGDGKSDVERWVGWWSGVVGMVVVGGAW
jgi:hypothetical protein